MEEGREEEFEKGGGGGVGWSVRQEVNDGLVMEEAEESETCWLFEELRRVGASNLPRVASTWMFKAGVTRQ